MKRSIIKAVFAVSAAALVLLLLSGCLPGDGKATEENPAGFFWGIWHGWVAPVSLVISLFRKDISLYEIFNKGWWYDLGFYIAVISGFGGISFRRHRKSKKSGDPHYEDYD